MPDLDLDPREYTVKGRKEPILNNGWWLTILIFIAVVIFGQVVIRPVYVAAHSFMMELWRR